MAFLHLPTPSQICISVTDHRVTPAQFISYSKDQLASCHRRKKIILFLANMASKATKTGKPPGRVSKGRGRGSGTQRRTQRSVSNLSNRKCMSTVCAKPLTARQKRPLAKCSVLITCSAPRLRAKILSGGQLDLTSSRELPLDDFWKAYEDHIVRLGLRAEDKENEPLEMPTEEVSWHLQTMKRPSIMS